MIIALADAFCTVSVTEEVSDNVVIIMMKKYTTFHNVICFLLGNSPVSQC